MSAKGLVTASCLAICGLILFCAPGGAYGERWLEFHAEKWNYKSEKLNKKLQFKNVYYYDADNLLRGKNGDVTVWVKESLANDSYYVRKGAPAQETIYKNIRISCRSKGYEIVSADGGEAEYSESMGDAITPGSCYDQLQSIVCEP